MRLSFLACTAILILVSACATPPRGGGGVQLPRPGPDQLLQRAEELWRARLAEDWAAAYVFEDPALREHTTVEQFTDWCVQNEPFIVKSYKLGQARVDGELGWVELNSSAALRRFPALPPREVNRWEKWRIVDGQWYPVPRPELNNYPESPALRDAPAEARLAARLEEAWRSRHEKDWPARYALVDPRERDRITVEELANDEDRFDYLAAKVLWVQVIADRGLARVQYQVKRNDPSLTKMAPEVVDVIERWVQFENEWYRQLGTKSQ